MNRLTIIIGFVLLVLNFLIGLIVESYPTFNVCLNSGVIVIMTLLICITHNIVMKDAFKVSLTTLFGFIGLAKFIIGLFAENQIVNNWHLLSIIILTGIEIILLITTNVVSNKIK